MESEKYATDYFTMLDVSGLDQYAVQESTRAQGAPTGD